MAAVQACDVLESSELVSIADLTVPEPSGV